jgi:hypothetical protein
MLIGAGAIAFYFDLGNGKAFAHWVFVKFALRHLPACSRASSCKAIRLSLHVYDRGNPGQGPPAAPRHSICSHKQQCRSEALPLLAVGWGCAPHKYRHRRQEPVSCCGTGHFEKRRFLMRKVLLILLVLAALVIGLGFYLNWFSLALKDGNEQINISVTVDKEKIQSDVGKAKEEIKNMAEKDKADGSDDSEKTKGSAPAVLAKDENQ